MKRSNCIQVYRSTTKNAARGLTVYSILITEKQMASKQTNKQINIPTYLNAMNFLT